jgi:hypothetical protein
MKTMLVTKVSQRSRSFSARVLLCVGSLWVAAEAAGQNLVSNPGFETNTGNGTAPTGWTKDFNSYGAYNGAYKTGSWCLHVGNASASGGEYQDITTEIGVTYTVSAWAQNFGSAAGSSHLDVLIGTPGTATYNFPNANTPHSTTKFAAGVTDNSFLVGGAWQQYTFAFTATGTTTRIGIYNSYKTGDTVHSINVDDVSVVPVVAAHHIAASVNGTGGSINPSGDVLVVDGASQTFTITANPGGYAIADVVVDGVSQPAAVSSGSYTFSANNADHTITASFTAPPPQLFTDAASSSGKFIDNWSTGTQFTTGANPIYVTHLGYVDWNSADNGFGDGFTGSPQVGLWQGAHGDASPTLITTVTIPTGTAATLVGKFRYVTLPTPITLQPNTTYQLMGYGYSTDPTVHWSAGSGTVDPTLGLSGFRAEAHSGGLGFGDLNADVGWTSPNVATSANFIWTFTAPSFHEGTLISFF